MQRAAQEIEKHTQQPVAAVWVVHGAWWAITPDDQVLIPDLPLLLTPPSPN